MFGINQCAKYKWKKKVSTYLLFCNFFIIVFTFNDNKMIDVISGVGQWCVSYNYKTII